MPQLDQQIIPSQDPIHRDIFRNSLVVQNISPIIRHDASQNILCSKKKLLLSGSVCRDVRYAPFSLQNYGILALVNESIKLKYNITVGGLCSCFNKTPSGEVIKV